MNKNLIVAAVIGTAFVGACIVEYLDQKRRIERFNDTCNSMIDEFDHAFDNWDNAVSAARAAYDAAEASNMAMVANQQAMDMAMMAHEQATNMFFGG